MRICLEIICLKTKHGFIASLHLQVNFEGLTGDVKFTETKFRRINILDANEITRSQRYKVKSRCISPYQARAQTSTKISLGGGGQLKTCLEHLLTVMKSWVQTRLVSRLHASVHPSVNWLKTLLNSIT